MPARIKVMPNGDVIAESFSDGAGGIEFNKNNDADAAGNPADWIRLSFVDNTPAPNGAFLDGPVAWGLEQTGSSGGFEEVMSGDAPMVWANNGNGATDTGFSGAPITLPNGGKVGQHWINNGQGAQWMKNSNGITLIENEGEGIVLYSSGSDASNRAIRLILAGDLTLENLPASNPGGTDKVWKGPGGFLMIT